MWCYIGDLDDPEKGDEFELKWYEFLNLHWIQRTIPIPCVNGSFSSEMWSTRVTSHSAIIIDSICTNITDNQIKSGLLINMYDHLPVFLAYKNNKNNNIDKSKTI